MIKSIYVAIIGIFVFMIIKNLFLYVKRKDNKFLFISSFFVCYLIMIFFKRILSDEVLYSTTIFRILYVINFVVVSISCVLLGGSYLNNKLLNKYTIGYFIVELIAIFVLFIVNVTGFVSNNIFVSVSIAMVSVYAFSVTIYTILYYFINHAHCSFSTLGFAALMICLTIKTLYMALDITIPLILLAGIFIFIVVIEIDLIYSFRGGHRVIPTEKGLDILTEKELLIASKLLEGKSYKEASAELDISINMISKISSVIYRKTHCKSKTELILHFNSK